MNVRSAAAHENPKAEAILEAALSLFVERGFHGTPVPVIAQTAGVAAGTIYRSFAGKEALVNVLYRRCKTHLMQMLLEGLDVSAEPRQVFRHIWFRLAQMARERPRELDFLELHHHGSYLDEESLALENQSLAPFYAYFATDRAKEAFKALAPEALMALVLGAFFGLYKACRLGHLEWTELLVADAELAAWDSVSR